MVNNKSLIPVVDEDVGRVALVSPDGHLLSVLPNAQTQYEYAQHVALDYDRQGQDNPFCVMDVGNVIRQHQRWMRALPRVAPYYAVKCNNDPMLLRVLAALGCGFDCASRGEIDQVMNDMNMPPSKIIYANPCKTRSYITHAYECGVNMMTYDNVDELHKIAKYHPSAEMVLRIAVSDHTAQCPLNIKFGADPETADALLVAAAEMGIAVIGVSFHIGSGARSAEAWARGWDTENGIAHARRLFEVGSLLGHDMKLLDLGGGFIGAQNDPKALLFEDAAACINSALDHHFADLLNTHIIAEPGRYFASTAFTLSCGVIAKTMVPASRITQKPEDVSEPGHMYYLNDGVYGSFNCVLYDHQEITPLCLFPETDLREYTYATVWGPTCDGFDCLLPNTRLPKLVEGDWLTFENMGAYTSAAGSTFNGMPRPDIHYYISATDLILLANTPHIRAMRVSSIVSEVGLALLPMPVPDDCIPYDDSEPVTASPTDSDSSRRCSVDSSNTDESVVAAAVY